MEKELFGYYKEIDNKTLSLHEAALDQIRRILQGAANPRWLLAELYSGDVRSQEAREIVKQARPLRGEFDPIWKMGLRRLEETASNLFTTDFTQFTQPMQRIVHFLDADFDVRARRIVYLLPNPLQHKAVGHTINETQFMLVRPSGDASLTALQDTVATIAHEYGHMIEHSSRISREILKESYKKYIGDKNITSPNGYTWRDVYVETLIYSLASKTIGGFLSPEIYQKPATDISLVRNNFQKLVAQNKYTTYQLMNWVALNILPDVEEYIKWNKLFDERIVDRMSGIFLKYT